MRDPRKDPRSGDVLRYQGDCCGWRITRVEDGYVWDTPVDPHDEEFGEELSMQIDIWLATASCAEVIHAD